MDPDASPVAAVVQVGPQTGERTILYMANRYKFLTAADIPLDVVRQTKLVLVDGFEHDAAPIILEAVREAGGHSLVDIEGGDSENAFRLLELGTDCILPIGVARTLTGKETAEGVLHRLAEKTAAQLIVTDGVHGSWALTEAGVLHQPAFAVAAVDTTGCGDAFHGAYGAGSFRGASVAPPDGTGRLGRFASCAQPRWAKQSASISRF